MKNADSQHLSDRMRSMGFRHVKKSLFTQKTGDVELLVELSERRQVRSSSDLWIPRFSIFNQDALECLYAYRPVERGTSVGLLFGSLHFLPSATISESFEHGNFLEVINIFSNSVQDELYPFVSQLHTFRELRDYLLSTKYVTDHLFPPQTYRKPLAGVLSCLIGEEAVGFSLIEQASIEIEQTDLKPLFAGVRGRVESVLRRQKK